MQTKICYFWWVVELYTSSLPAGFAREMFDAGVHKLCYLKLMKYDLMDGIYEIVVHIR